MSTPETNQTTTEQPATEPQAAAQTAQQEQEVTGQQLNPIAQVKTYLENKMRGEIAKALPDGIDPDRFIRTVVTAVQMNPDLAYADRRSLFGSCMRAAQDGLIPDGREAVLNIYNTKVKTDRGEQWVPTVQYLPMVRGLLKVARNSGEVAHIDAAAVYEKDEFAFERGDDPKLIHRPYLGEDDPGKVIAAYMIVKLTNGEVHREVMSRRDIEKVREASKSKNGPGWSTWYDQFAIKSVIKRGTKLLPQSSDRLSRVIEHDNEAMGIDFTQNGLSTQPAIEAPQAKSLPSPSSRPSRMEAIVGKTKQAEPVASASGSAEPASQAAE